MAEELRTLSAGRRTAARLIWAATMVALVPISAYAVWRTAQFVAYALTPFPGPYGRAGLVFTAVYFVGAAALVLAAGAPVLHRRLSKRAVLVSIVAITVVIRVVLMTIADAPLTGENRIVYQQAVGVLDGACCMGHRPMGYPIALAGAFRILGVGPAAVETLNLLLAVVTVMLVWDIGRVTWGARIGSAAAMGYAVAPSTALLTLVPLTEPLYTAAITLSFRLAIDVRQRWSGWVATGAALALAQYVRATAVSLLLPVVALAFLTARRASAALLRTLVTMLAFVVLLGPVIAYNAEAHGDWSISTSAYGGWSLFVGGNRAHGGMWNAEDAALLSTFPGTTVWEKSEYAGSLAWDRYREDLGGTLGLFVQKAGLLWGDEKYAAAYALPTTNSREPTRVMWVGWLSSQIVWAALLVLALVGTWAERRTLRPATLLVGMTVLLVAGSHLLLEVHSRYHAYLLPLLWLIAAVGVDWLRHRLWGVPDSPVPG